MVEVRGFELSNRVSGANCYTAAENVLPDGTDENLCAQQHVSLAPGAVMCGTGGNGSADMLREVDATCCRE